MSILDITGIREISIGISNALEKGNCNIELIGQEGRGKTTTIEAVATSYANPESTFITLRGNDQKTQESFYPLKDFVDRKEKVLKRGIVVFKEAVGAIPYAGKTLKAFLDEIDLKSLGSKKTIENVEPFKLHIDFSLHLIGLLNKYRKVIIVCDDFNLFDSATIQYLTSLQEGLLILNKPFSISFILVSDKHEQVLSLLSPNPTYSFPLAPLNSFQIREVVALWSGENPTEQQLELIQSCSSGHLQLIKIICAYLRENQGKLQSNIPDNFLKSIIDARLQQLKGDQEKIIQLLIAVLQSGKNTSMYELICLLGEDSGMQEVLKSAIQLNLLLIKDNQVQFTHPLIESYINSVRQSNKITFYEKLGKCVQKLTPSNYARRALISELSFNNDRVDILWALDYIRRIREGVNPNQISDKISTSYLGLKLKNALKEFALCYQLALSGALDETIVAVDGIPDSLPMEVVAEKYFLKAETLAKKIAKQPKEEALGIITIWETIKEDEPEIWYRFMQVKILLAAELGFLEMAKETEGRIVKYFSGRITYDREAIDTIDRLNIFSEILYTPEVAHKKLLNTELKLAKDIEDERFHKLVDLYITEVNLSANSFVLSDYVKAIKHADRALTLTTTYSDIRFPYKEVPISNLYLALVFHTPTELSTIEAKYLDLYSSAIIEENKMLIDINYAGLLLLNHRYAEAINVLEKSCYIPIPEIDDNFYAYYYWSNYAIISHFLKLPTAKESLLKVEGIVEGVSLVLSKYYVRHYKLLLDIIGNENIKNYKEMASLIEKQAPVFSSKIWNRFKTGYLFTDIQIWTSS